MAEEKTALEQQLVGLGTLLQLEKQARHASDEAELGFVVVNETLRLLAYRQAVLFRRRGRKAKVLTVSGVDKPNRNAPYVLWLEKVFAFLQKKTNEPKPLVVSEDLLPKKLQAGWQEWAAPACLWCPLGPQGKKNIGGLWLMRDTPWQPSEIALVEQLVDSYSHSWQALAGKSSPRRAQSGWLGRVARVFIFAGVGAAMFLPVKLSVLAPAQVVPLDPLVVSAPMQGVVQKFHVEPNQQVKKGQLLFSLDDTELRNRYRVAQKTLAVARAEYQRASQKSLFERDSGIDIDVLKAKVAGKKAEVNFAKEELARIESRAEQAGIVVFADVNDWLGKPVVTGEKILLLADPARKELEVEVPLDNAINLEAGARLRFFLNVAPGLDIQGQIRQTSYEAKQTASGTLAYIVKATLDDEQPQMRIGLQGTAKVYGKETRLYYYLFRRPWAAMRRALGL